jgi:hypothetical protein
MYHPNCQIARLMARVKLSFNHQWHVTQVHRGGFHWEPEFLNYLYKGLNVTSRSLGLRSKKTSSAST